MKTRFVTFGCVVAAIGFVGAFAYALNTPASSTDQLLAPFEFKREAAPTPEIAAQSLFLGIATASPKEFVHHLLLGVCNNEIDTLQRFAESLHATQFDHDNKTFKYYDLRDQKRMIDRKKRIRVIASAAYDAADPQVNALQLEAASTYYGKTFACFDVVAEGYYDGLDYKTRIVVAQVDDGWYAIPRCRSSKSFYQIADAMQLTPAEAPEAK